MKLALTRIYSPTPMRSTCEVCQAAVGARFWRLGPGLYAPFLCSEACGLKLQAEQEIAFNEPWTRAGGDCVCTCGKKYYDHPMSGPLSVDGRLFMRRLCDGRLVKL